MIPLFAVFVALLVAPVEAAILGVSGTAVNGGSAAGIDLRKGVTENNDVVGYDENQCVAVPEGTISVDYLNPPIGVQLGGVLEPPAEAPTLPAGKYSSHILHFDPVGDGGGSTSGDATFDFGTPVFAVIANTTFLNSSDSTFGNAAFYHTDLDRRWEEADQFTVNSLTQLTAVSAETAGGFIDELRVITKCSLDVLIDIKPGSDPNCFNSNDHGVIPVAILGSEDFDVSTVDPFSVSLDGQEVRVKGKSGNAGSLEDVNGDGFSDLVVQINDDAAYAIGDTIGTLTGLTFDGIPIEGTDSICITQ